MRPVLLGIALALAWAIPCQSTTIVAVRTPGLFVIAADSAVTFKGGSAPESISPLPKIFEKGKVLYAIAGLSKDTHRGFDPERIIADSITGKRDLKASFDISEKAIIGALKVELERLSKEEPAIFQATLGDKKGTTILLASHENGEPIAIGTQFIPEVKENGEIDILLKRLACPGDCPKGILLFYMGSTDVIKKHLASNKVNLSAVDAMRLFVQLEIDAGTPGVGPPIDIATIDEKGVHWIQRHQVNPVKPTKEKETDLFLRK